MCMFRKIALLSLPAMIILAATSCRPERPWAQVFIEQKNLETKVIIKGDDRCCASKNFESSSEIGKY